MCITLISNNNVQKQRWPEHKPDYTEPIFAKLQILILLYRVKSLFGILITQELKNGFYHAV